MINLMLFPHAITFILCAAVLTVTVRNSQILLKRNTLKHSMFIAFAFVCVFQTVTILTFVVNQIIWIVNQHDANVGLTASLSWLAYDYANTLFHLTVGVALNFFLTTHE